MEILGFWHIIPTTPNTRKVPFFATQSLECSFPLVLFKVGIERSKIPNHQGFFLSMGLSSNSNLWTLSLCNPLLGFSPNWPRDYESRNSTSKLVNLGLPMFFQVVVALSFTPTFVSMDSPSDFTSHMNLWAFFALQNVGSSQGVIFANFTVGNV